MSPSHYYYTTKEQMSHKTESTDISKLVLFQKKRAMSEMVDKGKLNKRRWGGCYPNLAVGFSLYCQEWEQSGHHGPYLETEFKKQLSGVRADKCPKCPYDLQMAMRGSAGSGWCHSKPFHCCHPLINNFDVTAQKVTKIVSGRLWNLQ